MTQSNFEFSQAHMRKSPAPLVEVICREDCVMGADLYLITLGLDGFEVEDVEERDDGTSVLCVSFDGAENTQNIVLPRGFHGLAIERSHLFEAHESVTGFSKPGWQEALDGDWQQTTIIGPETKIRALQELVDNNSPINRATLLEQLRDVRLL